MLSPDAETALSDLSTQNANALRVILKAATPGTAEEIIQVQYIRSTNDYLNAVTADDQEKMEHFSGYVQGLGYALDKIAASRQSSSPSHMMRTDLDNAKDGRWVLLIGGTAYMKDEVRDYDCTNGAPFADPPAVIARWHAKDGSANCDIWRYTYHDGGLYGEWFDPIGYIELDQIGIDSKFSNPHDTA